MDAAVYLVVILAPLAVGLLILLLPPAAGWLREALALIASAVGLSASIVIYVAQPGAFRFPLFSVGGFSLSFDLLVTPLASFMLLFAFGFALFVVLYSFFYMRGRPRRGEFYGFMLFAVGGAAGVLLADHLILLLIFWEIVSASLYFLVTTGSPESKVGATKTLAMLGGGDGCLLIGIGLFWVAGASLALSGSPIPIGSALSVFAFLFMMIASITKAGSLPFHSWIPAASDAAPAPVMALLPAAIDKLLGIYLLTLLVTRLFVPTWGISLTLMVIGAVTVVAAVMVAMVQHDLRRLLSYHAISQVGYMVLGIGTLTPIGIAGGLFHMLNNAVYKSCLFLSCGAVEKRAGTTDLSRLGGLSGAMPTSLIVTLIAALAISGVPPLNGFVSKWLIYQGLIETGAGGSFVFLIAVMFGSALTLASFIKVVYSVFLGTKTEITRDVTRDAALVALVPMSLLAAVCLFFGIYYQFPLTHFIYPAIGATPARLGFWGSSLATGLIVLGLVVGLLISLVGRFAKSARTVKPFIGGEELDPEGGRIIGTDFYDTIRSLPGLKEIYAAQEKGRLDPYTWIGGVGLFFSRLLKRLHTGLLPWYLSWSLFGLVIILFLFLGLR